MDLALPGSVSLSELLPSILRFSGLESNNPTDAVHAWVLQRFGSDPFDLYTPVNKLGIRDGETLHLRQRENAIPDAAFDDVVDAVAGATNSRPSWQAAHSQRVGITLMLLALIGIPLLIILGQPPIDLAEARFDPSLRLPMALAVGVTGFLGFAAAIGSIALARAAGERRTAAALAWGSVALAGITGWFLPDPISEIVPLAVRIILAASLVLIAAATCALAASVHPMALFSAALAALLVVAGSSFMLLFPGRDVEVAAIAVTVTSLLTTFLPTLAYRIAGIALPNLPTTAEGILADETPVQSDIVKRALFADRLLGAMLAAMSVVTVLGAFVVISQATIWSTMLVLCIGFAYVLRARAFVGFTQRLALLLGGAITVVIGLYAIAMGPVQSLAGMVTLFAVALVLTYVFAHYSAALYQRIMAPTWGRWGDILEWVAIIGIIPALLGVLNLYEYFNTLL
ncbi:type VII secretion integral membrane protein EccD [Tessaracoccus lubricantis]|uniref:Type VII secretion integral membrane protein EccD n=1 Tax=Tessaracoccus lubricantis TaxID=545543 RepID=A0ABP9FDN1_9ACTN